MELIKDKGDEGDEGDEEDEGNKENNSSLNSQQSTLPIPQSKIQIRQNLEKLAAAMQNNGECDRIT
ncbi:hypothetical protein [Nostoc sp. ChiQUE01b]|uniref:hypothetical protein n=1 Tax=Nostoc sp. ChiQUE01b TaxID=3075376 RepID=UPI002AD4412A|nr:hypothetical protein [Nostoc sp. ChiQUE01b]MDZ8258605.1 hypothetical protein [Nostoc sp. ChiQUE01b]